MWFTFFLSFLSLGASRSLPSFPTFWQELPQNGRRLPFRDYFRALPPSPFLQVQRCESSRRMIAEAQEAFGRMYMLSSTFPPGSSMEFSHVFTCEQSGLLITFGGYASSEVLVFDQLSVSQKQGGLLIHSGKEVDEALDRLGAAFLSLFITGPLRVVQFSIAGKPPRSETMRHVYANLLQAGLRLLLWNDEIGVEASRPKDPEENAVLFLQKGDWRDHGRLAIQTLALRLMEWFIGAEEETSEGQEAQLDLIFWRVAGGKFELFNSYTDPFPWIRKALIKEKRRNPNFVYSDQLVDRNFEAARALMLESGGLQMSVADGGMDVTSSSPSFPPAVRDLSMVLPEKREGAASAISEELWGLKAALFHFEGLYKLSSALSRDVRLPFKLETERKGIRLSGFLTSSTLFFSNVELLTPSTSSGYLDMQSERESLWAARALSVTLAKLRRQEGARDILFMPPYSHEFNFPLVRKRTFVKALEALVFSTNFDLQFSTTNQKASFRDTRTSSSPFSLLVAAQLIDQVYKAGSLIVRVQNHEGPPPVHFLYPSDLSTYFLRVPVPRSMSDENLLNELNFFGSKGDLLPDFVPVMKKLKLAAESFVEEVKRGAPAGALVPSPESSSSSSALKESSRAERAPSAVVIDPPVAPSANTASEAGPEEFSSFWKEFRMKSQRKDFMEFAVSTAGSDFFHFSVVRIGNSDAFIREATKSFGKVYMLSATLPPGTKGDLMSSEKLGEGQPSASPLGHIVPFSIEVQESRKLIEIRLEGQASSEVLVFSELSVSKLEQLKPHYGGEEVEDVVVKLQAALMSFFASAPPRSVQLSISREVSDGRDSLSRYQDLLQMGLKLLLWHSNIVVEVTRRARSEHPTLMLLLTKDCGKDQFEKALQGLTWKVLEELKGAMTGGKAELDLVFWRYMHKKYEVFTSSNDPFPWILEEYHREINRGLIALYSEQKVDEFFQASKVYMSLNQRVVVSQMKGSMTVSLPPPSLPLAERGLSLMLPANLREGALGLPGCVWELKAVLLHFEALYKASASLQEGASLPFNLGMKEGLHLQGELGPSSLLFTKLELLSPPSSSRFLGIQGERERFWAARALNVLLTRMRAEVGPREIILSVTENPPNPDPYKHIIFLIRILDALVFSDNFSLELSSTNSRASFTGEESTSFSLIVGAQLIKSATKQRGSLVRVRCFQGARPEYTTSPSTSIGFFLRAPVPRFISDDALLKEINILDENAEVQLPFRAPLEELASIASSFGEEVKASSTSMSSASSKSFRGVSPQSLLSQETPVGGVLGLSVSSASNEASKATKPSERPRVTLPIPQRQVSLHTDPPSTGLDLQEAAMPASPVVTPSVLWPHTPSPRASSPREFPSQHSFPLGSFEAPQHPAAPSSPSPHSAIASPSVAWSGTPFSDIPPPTWVFPQGEASAPTSPIGSPYAFDSTPWSDRGAVPADPAGPIVWPSTPSPQNQRGFFGA